MNLTTILLFQSEKSAIVPHLLLAPGNTVVKPAEHEFVRRPSLLLEAQQSFQQNLESKTTMTSVTAVVPCVRSVCNYKDTRYR